MSANVEARHLAGLVTDAAMFFSMIVMASREDVQAAIDDGDAATAIECLDELRMGLRYCESLLRGEIVGVDYDLLTAFVERPELPLPPPPQATLDEARALLAEAIELCDSFSDRLPFDFPLVRSPEGFFPAIRIMRELGRLRSDIGLDPYPWELAST